MKVPPGHNMPGLGDYWFYGSVKMMLEIKQLYMQKPDFEKKVQEKMKELRFRPSDEVWKRVEAGITERTRRPFAFFWLPAAVLVLGVVGYYSYINVLPGNKHSTNRSNQPGQSIASKQNVQDNTDPNPREKVVLPSSSAKNHHSDANDANVPK